MGQMQSSELHGWALTMPKHNCLRALALQQHLRKGPLPDGVGPLKEVIISIGAVSIRLPYRGG